jgi:hypothetical protein
MIRSTAAWSSVGSDPMPRSWASARRAARELFRVLEALELDADGG